MFPVQQVAVDPNNPTLTCRNPKTAVKVVQNGPDGGSSRDRGGQSTVKREQGNGREGAKGYPLDVLGPVLPCDGRQRLLFSQGLQTKGRPKSEGALSRRLTRA